MKRTTACVSLLLAGVLLLAGCSLGSANPAGKDYVGRYVKQGSTTDYTEIRSDGTFVFLDRGQSKSGTFTVRGTEITLIVPGLGTAVGRLEPGRIIDNDGQVWVKSAGGTGTGAGN